MKKLYALIVLISVCAGAYSQVNYDAFVGTWVYQKNDTVFKIKLQKGKMHYNVKEILFGGYYLSVGGVVKDNYIKEMPSVWNVYASAPSSNIYIIASGNTLNRVGTTFFDQRKKHLNGKGLGGGEIKLIAPDKIHWTLNEFEGLWPYLEGEMIPGENRPSIKEAMIGFSVPTDVIMTKVN